MRILLTDVAYRRFWATLARPGVEPLVMDRSGAIDAAVPDADVAWGTSDLFADGAPLRPFFKLLLTAPSLRWFQSPAAGYDDRVFSELARRGVRITNAHVNGIPIAEYVLRAVLDQFQGAGRWRDAQAGRRWETHDYREVFGSTWLVIGLGSIGSGVARRAKAFGATVIGCRRHPDPADPTDRTVTPAELLSVAGEADVVVLAAPATSETSGLVDDAFLRAMKPRAVLVNVARGSLIDEAALLAALDRGTPEAAILDVFVTEPLPPDHPLWTHPAVSVTPHNAAGGTGRYGRQAELFATNLERYLAGEPLLNDVTELAARHEPGGPSV